MRAWDVPIAGALPHDPAVDPQGNVWFTLQEAGQEDRRHQAPREGVDNLGTKTRVPANLVHMAH